MNVGTLTKLLTIWIPTYRRPAALQALLRSIESSGLIAFADVVVSDNDPQGSLAEAVAQGNTRLRANAGYRCNVANLSAGVNFLRAFEHCSTPWLMIVGDDDLFALSAADIIYDQLIALPASVMAVKFDSDLFGNQPCCCVSSLPDYVAQLSPSSYPSAFNNLCFISNWVFNCESCCRHLGSAYLGYSSKLSHLFPPLQGCSKEGGKLLFLASQPVIHGSADTSSWPKAATWYEMVMTLSSFSGFANRSDRSALLSLLLHGDWRRYVIKCLRIQQFYANPHHGVTAWTIHVQLACLSAGYRFALLLVLPLLLFSVARWPRLLIDQLGDPGSIDRW